MKLNATMAACLLTALAMASIASGAQVPRSPNAIYHALLTSSIPDSQLPAGFYSSSTGLSSVSDRAKQHHAVGEVEIDIDSGDAGLLYIVFATRADAVADWRDADLKKSSKSTLAAPDDLPWPALITNSSITGKNLLGKKVTNGVTIVGFTSKNVIVEALTTSTENTDSGDIPGAIKLARFGLKHLQALR